MTLDQLRYFQAVCKYDSVSRAAESLNISQPSVSAAIHKLETEFGTTLFIRQNKHLMLTKEGVRLLEYAEDLLQNADHMLKTMKDLSDSKVLNLGIPPMLGSYLLPLLYGHFFKDHPQFKMNVIEDDRSGLIRMLESNKINMAFLPHDAPFDATLRTQPLAEFENVCCMSKNHRLAQKTAISIADLQEEPLVLFKNSFFQTERILARFKQCGCSPNILLNTMQVSTMKSIAASGLAVGFLFAFLLNATPELTGIPLEPPMRTQVSLVWKQSEYISGNMSRLIRFVKACSENVQQ